MKKLINDKERFLSDMLDGLKHRDPAIEVIEGTVVVRKDRKKKNV